MQSLWNDKDAAARVEEAGADQAARDLALRVYTSRLIGHEPDLVLHGGGNTSVKVERDGRRVINVKGSGWDLGTIEAAGLPALLLAPLLEVRKDGKRLSDPEMVALLRRNMLDASGPNPSVETLLHAFLPAKFVDHTHSAAALAIANQPNAAELAREIFGKRLAVVAYVMPGFDLAIASADVFDEADKDCEGLFLVNHGLFSFHDDPRVSYERIIGFTSECEAFLARSGAALLPAEASRTPDATTSGQVLERLGSALKKDETFASGIAFDVRCNSSIDAFLGLSNFVEVAGRGTVTPDHVIRLKPKPMVGKSAYSVEDWEGAVDAFARDYKAYFNRHAPQADEAKTMLDPMPRLVLVQGLGVVGVGRDAKEAKICADLAEQAVRVMLSAEKLGRFTPISERELFDMEYWSLEQAKLKAG